MKGIEILSSAEIGIGSQFNWLTACIFFGVILVVGIALGIIGSVIDDNWGVMVVVTTISLAFALFIGTIIGDATSTIVEYETQYKVTISDEVSMNEFLDKYEIIDQEGKIYTVREREQSEANE